MPSGLPRSSDYRGVRTIYLRREVLPGMPLVLATAPPASFPLPKTVGYRELPIGSVIMSNRTIRSTGVVQLHYAHKFTQITRRTFLKLFARRFERVTAVIARNVVCFWRICRVHSTRVRPYTVSAHKRRVDSA